MKKIIFALCLAPFALSAYASVMAAPRGTPVAAMAGDVPGNPADFMTPVSFNMMAPFMTQDMRERLHPGDTTRAPNPTGAFGRAAAGAGVTPASAFTPAISGTGRAARSAHNPQPAIPVANNQQPRRVVQRPGAQAAGANTARSATPAHAGVQPSIARSATTPPEAPQTRRVVARSGRVDASRSGQPPPGDRSFIPNMTAEECLAGYMACMDGYCARPNMAFNRCFCSVRLSQIDSQYRPAIDAALRKVVILENGGSLSDNLTDTELELMWNNTFAGVGHQSDSISNLNAALSGIDFADFESRVRGQNAFAAGHEFCIQHLPACFYAGTNMIGVYRSVIARDCNAYERRLRAVLTLAENTVATLSR